MTHILHVVDLLQIGGAQNMILTFVREARQRGIEVSVACLSEVNATIPAIELEKMSVPVSVFPSNHLADPVRIASLTRFMRSQPFDLVHTHLAYGNILGGLAGKLAGLPVVATLHSSGNDQVDSRYKGFNSPRSRAEVMALRFFADKIIAVGENVRDAQQSRLGGITIDVIPNAVSQPFPITEQGRKQIREQILVDPDQPLLISVGRFAVVKEFSEMIMAFRKVKERYPKAGLVIIGDGSERPRMENLIAELDLNQSVHLPGRQSNVSSWLQASDLYISSSSLEGMPISILEAMSAGLPVVSTATGDIPRVVLPDMGILVPIHEPMRLAEAICTLLDQPEVQKNMGVAARTHALQDHSVSTWFNRLWSLYEDVWKIKNKNGSLSGRPVL
jgi:glycosyltransferase involved in cell wall biosynthesis